MKKLLSLSLLSGSRHPGTGTKHPVGQICKCWFCPQTGRMIHVQSMPPVSTLHQKEMDRGWRKWVGEGREQGQRKREVGEEGRRHKYPFGWLEPLMRQSQWYESRAWAGLAKKGRQPVAMALLYVESVRQMTIVLFLMESWRALSNLERKTNYSAVACCE